MRTLNGPVEVDEVHLTGAVVIRRPWAQTYWPWALVACAWGVALLATLSRHSELVDHDYLLEHRGLPWVAALAIFLTCWQVMTAAMMVPSALPVLHRAMHGIGGTAQHGQAVFLVGYFLVWTSFAGAAFLADTSIHVLVESWAWLSQHTEAIGATTLAAAGLFQFSPLKRASLAACRSPFGSAGGRDFVTLGAAWRFGLHHGLACLGSGWALMLVMFGLGVGGIGWMLALTSVMVVEKDIPSGRWLTPIVGIVLLALALVWWMHPGWLPLVAA